MQTEKEWKIEKERLGDSLTLRLTGRLDTETSQDLQNVIEKELDGVRLLTVDMTELTYLTSAGLRVLLHVSKRMNTPESSVVVSNPNNEIREVFKITGFDGILNIE